MGKVCDMRDLEGLGATLTAFSSEARGKVLMDAVTAGAKVLQQQTVAELTREMGGAALRKGLKGRPQYSNHTAMVEGVRLLRDKAYATAAVSIMGDFRLKWFEKGTDRRYAGGGRKKKDGTYAGNLYRGYIKAKAFFSRARDNDKPVADAITESISNSLKKILK